jgi:hypothetical protein
MAGRVFYSFHYDADVARASQVRNIGVVEGNRPATDNEWETVKRGGDIAIARWIAEEMQGKSCCIVLIGAQTASRKWVNHEIAHAWNEGKGVFGIYIHNLKDLSGRQAVRGLNPFDYVSFESGTALSSIVRAYDPPSSDSRQAYAHIANNLASWIDEAIRTRR